MKRRIAIERLNVGDTHVEALVRVGDLTEWRTSAAPGLVGRAMELLPNLRRHHCENGSPHGIMAELADTETPHLLEHVACELMALSGSPRTLAGSTAWNSAIDGVGVARISLEYDDDLVALGALSCAAEIVDWLLKSAEETASELLPDVTAMVAQLHGFRE